MNTLDYSHTVPYYSSWFFYYFCLKNISQGERRSEERQEMCFLFHKLQETDNFSTPPPALYTGITRSPHGLYGTDCSSRCSISFNLELCILVGKQSMSVSGWRCVINISWGKQLHSCGDYCGFNRSCQVTVLERYDY